MGTVEEFRTFKMATKYTRHAGSRGNGARDLRKCLRFWQDGSKKKIAKPELYEPREFPMLLPIGFSSSDESLIKL